MLDKTTSRYRVPADQQQTTERLHKLDAAYADARSRQERLQMRLTPGQFIAMAEDYHRGLAADIERHARLRQRLERLGLLGLARRIRGRWLRLRGR